MAKKQNTAMIIFKRELKAYFTSPIAYIVTALFLFATGLFFIPPFFINKRADFSQLFGLLPLFLSFVVPALTMRIFSEEKRVGSIETLMTLPVSEKDVVFGKWFASFISTLVLIAPTLIYLIPACIYGKPDMGPILGGYLGTVFLAACYSAIGCFSSSVTKNQIVAFFIGLLICIALTLIDMFLIFLPGPAVTFLSYFSAKYHFTSIARGILDTRDLIYFVSLGSLFFVLTVKVQQNAKA